MSNDHIQSRPLWTVIHVIKFDLANNYFLHEMDVKYRWRFIRLFQHRLVLFEANGSGWLIGAQVAALLRKETYNLYQSFKRRGIPFRKASIEEVSYLISSMAVLSKRPCITLLSYTPTLCYMADELIPCVSILEDASVPCAEPRLVWCPQRRRKQFYTVVKPNIHRRKPFPWNVNRSLKRRELISPRWFGNKS